MGTLVHYDGFIGDFKFDDSVFKLCSIDEIGLSKRSKDDDGMYLKYIGDADSGTKVKLPDGLMNARGMFCGNDNIQTACVLPEDVTDTTAMFKNCKNLILGADIGDMATHASQMYQGCESLIFPGHVPKSLKAADYMYDGCKKLRVAPDIPKGTTNCTATFRGCESITEDSNLDHSANCRLMYAGCVSLKEAKHIPDKCQGELMFADCKSLETVKVPSELGKVGGMFVGCDKLAEQGIDPLSDAKREFVLNGAVKVNEKDGRALVGVREGSNKWLLWVDEKSIVQSNDKTCSVNLGTSSKEYRMTRKSDDAISDKVDCRLDARQICDMQALSVARNKYGYDSESVQRELDRFQQVMYPESAEQGHQRVAKSQHRAESVVTELQEVDNNVDAADGVLP